MKYIENTIGMLGDTEVSSDLRAIYDFYNSIQPDFERFTEEFGLKCPSSCGECCAHFIPDITPSEALILAAQVMFGEKKNLLQERLKADTLPKIVCPFYDPWKEHHCMVYSSRPLVCRMFHSCASMGKDGAMHFSRCRFNEESSSVSDAELASSGHHFRPMGDYGEMLETLPGNSSATELLPDAVVHAMNRIGYALNLLFPENGVFSGDTVSSEDLGA